LKEKSEDAKVVIKLEAVIIQISTVNAMAKRKKTSNDLKNSTQKTKE
jgi:hypothetical protein